MNESYENSPIAEQANVPETDTGAEAREANLPENPAPQKQGQNPEATAEKKAEIPKEEAAAGASPAVADKPEPDSAIHADSQRQTREPPKRNFEAEWKELAEAHPEVVGTTLPQDIFEAIITSDKPPLRVYESMMLQHLQSEISQLKQENDRLRQNADNAQRAPVTGTSTGGSAHTEEEDPFVTAFKRYH